MREETSLKLKEQEGENDVQLVEVCEFYSVPRVGPKTVGQYVHKS